MCYTLSVRHPERATPPGQSHDDLNPLRIRRLLCAISDSELQLLDMSAVNGRPENLLIDRLLVPPVAIRPSVDAGPQGSNEDDLTVKLSEILTVCTYHVHTSYIYISSMYPARPHSPSPPPYPPRLPLAPTPPLPPHSPQVNSIIRCALEGGKATTADVSNDWEFLQLQTALYLNGASVPGVRAEWQEPR